jgi:hypothetical protein
MGGVEGDAGLLRRVERVFPVLAALVLVGG